MNFIVTIVLTVGSSVTLDVNPTFIFEASTPVVDACGTAWLPHVVTVDPHPGCETYRTSLGYEMDTLEHELVHSKHWNSLGPAFPIAYIMTAGRAFEDYEDMMWEAPPDMHNNCPMFRVQGNSLSFMPCWQMGH